MSEFIAQLPTNTPEKRNAVGNAISHLADVCRELSTQNQVIIHASEKPQEEWSQDDGVSVAWDTQKLRGRIRDANTLYASIASAGDLDVETVIEKIREKCTSITIQKN